MSALFSEDSPFMNALFRLSDIVALNILFIVTCLPIFTIGAALTALNYTAITAIRYEDGYITRKYFKSFRQNFKQSTLTWLIMLVVGAVLFFDVYFWVDYWKINHATMSQVMIVVSVIMAFVYLMIFVWLFPITSKFQNTIKKNIWNAFVLSIKHFPWTLLLCAIAAIIPFLLYQSFYAIIFMVVCGFGALAYACAFLFTHIFKQYIKEDADEEGTENKSEDTADDADSADDKDTTDSADDADSADGKAGTAGKIVKKGRTVRYINSFDGTDEDA